jgi:hypothetical protein
MADTVRNLTALQGLLADNTDRSISPQDLRDAVYTCLGGWGSLYVVGGATAQSLTANTPAKLTCFAADGPSRGTTPANATDDITVSVDGTYQVQATLSFTSNVNGAWHHFRLAIDGTSTNYRSRVYVATGANGGHVSIACPALALTADEAVSINVESDTTSQLTVIDGSLGVKLIG